MIKVNNVTIQHPPQGVDAVSRIVTEGKLVLIECEPKEALFAISSMGEKKVYISCGNLLRTPCKYFKLIIISEIERVPIDGWYYNIRTKTLHKRDGNEYVPDSANCRAVLALPEHFSSQSLQDIVDGKLKEGKCLVECEWQFLSGNGWMNKAYVGKFNPNIETRNIIKLNPHITIYPVEEMDKELQLRACRAELAVARKQIIELQEQLCAPVEEEMVPISVAQAAYSGGYGDRHDGNAPDFQQWFKQNVK